MRKPSKLLSLFLAFVMVLTSLSVGLTAFAAPEQWKNSATYTGTGDGSPDITPNIHAIAVALYGTDFTTAPYDGERIQNLLSLGNSSPYYHAGTYIVDDEYGNGYTIVKNAFEILFTKGDRSNVDRNGGDTISDALKDYMGEDFPAQWTSGDYWYWPTMIGAYHGANGAQWNARSNKASGCNGSTYYKQSSLATVVKLDSRYTMWNSYGDVLADIPESGVLPTVKTFYWQNGNTGTGNSTSGNSAGNTDDRTKQVANYELDANSEAILVNAAELKAFGELFTDIWEAFGSGDFDNVPSATFTDILTTGMDLMEAVRDNTHNYAFNGLRATPGYNSTTNTNNTVGTTAVNDTLTTDKTATMQIFAHFFPITADGIEGADIYEKFKALYDSFIEWMIKRFADAVNTIGESYTDGAINGGLSFEDFTELKRNFTDAYNIWDAFPAELRNEETAQELKEKLDAYYYNENDTVDNVTSFVPAWNNASAQAYVDATEELEFASGEGYIIKNDAEFERVKELLDAAEALYGDIYWESAYDSKPDGTPDYSDLGLLSNSLLFESEKGNNVQGGAEVVAHAKSVWDGAYEAYREYLYRKFISVASANLDEYIKDTNGNGKVDEGDEIPEINVSLATMMVFRTKMQKVESAYDNLPDDIKERALVKFYMSIVAKIQEAIDSLDDWSRYNDLENPYYYNWDEKKKELSAKDDVTALLNSLNAFIDSETIREILAELVGLEGETPDHIGTLARKVIEQLIYDNADSIFKAIMGMVFPMIQQALKDTYVDAASTNAYNLQRNGARVVLFNVHADILFSDPDMFNNTFPAASDVTKINGFKGYTQYTNDADIKIAADEIAKAKDNWDNVNWDKVEFKIDNLSEFCDVLGTILRMIDKLVNMVLFDEPAIATTDCSASKTADIDKHHTKGYEKDLVPMLEALGITGLPKYADAKKLAKDQKWDELLEKVITAILDSVENMFNEGAATGILNLLPNLAYMLYWDKLTGPVIKGKGEYKGWLNENGFAMPSDVSGIGDLLAPLTELANLSLYGLAGIEHLDGAFINEKITGIKLGDTGIVLPEINWAAILGLGEMDRNATPTSRTDGQRKNINAIPEEVVLYFISYIAELITTNSDVFHDLIAGKLPEDNEKVAELFEKLYGNLINTASDPKAFAAVLLELVRTVEVDNYDWADYDTWEWEQSLVDYTGLPYAEKDVTDSIDTLSAIVVSALNKFVFKAESGENVSLTEFISTKDILTGDVINSLFKTIYSLDSATMEMILKFVEVKDGSVSNGIDISLDNVIGLLADYPDVKAVLEAWAENHPYIVDDVPSGEYEVTCNNKVDKEVDGETQEVDCGAKIIVTADSGTITCEECGQSITYTAEDVKVLTKTVSLFDDEEAITADMWNVSDVTSFKNALVTILDPFKYIVGAALAGDGTKISVAGIINVVLDDGYKNVIKPLLSVFENEADFTLDDSVQADTALDQILTMLINLVDAIAADPVNIIISVLPQLAAFIDNNGIQNLIGYFIQPFWNVISAVLDLVQLNNDFVPKTDSNRIYDNSLFDTISGIFLDDNAKGILTWENIQNNIFDLINNILLENIVTIGDEKYSIKLPAIDWADLAGSGTKGANSIVADKASVVVKILRYVWRAVRANSVTIEAFLTENVGEFWGKLSKYLTINDYEEDDFVYLVLTVINGLDSSDYDSTDIWDGILNAVYEPTTDVVYPVDEDGNTYTPEDVDKLVKFISGIAVGVVEEFVDGFDISQIGPTIYSSAVPGLIGKYALPLFESAEDVFKLLGIEYGYTDLIAALTAAGYSDVVTAIEAQGVETLADIDWSMIADDNLFAISNADQFTKALVTLLEPFMPLVGFLLNSGTIMVLDVVPLTGSNGYANALLPLLQTLEIDAVDADTYAADAEADLKNLLADIIGPLFAWVDNALWISEDANGPAGTLLSILPNLAKFFDNGGLQQFIGDITYPFSNLINTIMSILTKGEQDDIFALGFDIVMEMLSGGAEEDSKLIDKILDMIFGSKTESEITWYNFHEHIFDLAANYIKINGATISVDKDGNLVLDISVSGNPMTIVVPKYNLARLAGIDNTDKTKKATDTLLVIWQYLWDGILNNKTTFASVKSLLSNELGDAYTTKILDATLGKYIEKLLSSEGNEIVAALIQTMEATDASDYDSSADWKELLSKTFSPTVAEYPKNGYNSSDIDFVIETVSEILTKALDEFANIQLADIANGYLYQDSVVNAVAKIVLNLGTTGIADILGIIEMDLSKDGIADQLESLGYAAVAKAIRSAASVDDIDWNSITWNANSAEGFAKALAAAISPLEVVLGYLLTAGAISINGNEVLTIIGANGYDNAVKHLLEEAFGCTGLNDSAEYANVTELMAAIFNAIFGQIDSILASGNVVGSVLDAIPQLSAFIARGGVQQFVEDLLYPITNFIHPILSLVYDGGVFDFALGLLKSFGVIDFDLKWDTLQDNLIDVINSFLNFTVKGKDITITLNKHLTWAKLAGCATRPDTLLTILSYIWENVQGNKSAIETALKALLGDDTYANIKQYVNRFLKNADSDIVAAVVQVFRGFDASAHKADWSFLFKNYKQTNVKYPKGVTSADIEEVIEILTVAIENALEIFLDTTLPTLAGDVIYTDSIINSVKNIVNSLAENDTVKAVFGMLGIEINVNNNTYKVTDKESFAAALADVLKPFEPILNAFLNKGSITIADVVTLTGADGFNNAIKPLLEYALGCTNVNDRTLKGIITAVLNRVEEILADPVNELIDIVPMISNFIGKGGVQYFVEELLYPVINVADAIISLITDDSLFDFAFTILGIDLKWSNLQNEIVPFANSKLKNVTINGKNYSITIPSIDWLKLGGCGKLSGTTIRANQGDVVMTLLGYIFKAIEANKEVLYDLVGKDSTLGEIITNILNEGADGFVKIIVTVLLKMDTFDNVSWLFKNIKPVVTTYTPNYGEEDYARFVQDIDEAIFGLLSSFTDLNVGTLLNDQVYKNSIVNTVAKLVYTNLEKITVAGISIHKILKALDLDITTATVADMLKDFSAASAEIGKHGAWNEVNFDAITWNFEDGDKTGFINALSAALRPIQPLIRVILSGEDLIVLGSIHIKGGNGYNTTVIPLLEALGVSPESLVSPADYSAAADTDKVLTSVLTPVLDLAETLLDKPILTLCNMLPNVAYFLLNGGAQAIVENIAGPVFNLLEEVAPIYDLNVDKLLKDKIGFGISDLGNLDLDGLVNTLLATIEIKGQPLTIRITDIDLETLAGRGSLVEYTSARTYNGVRMECKKIVADAPAVFISVLRYIVANLKANLDAIKDLLAGFGLSGDIADMVEMVLGFLTDLDTDMVIEQLMELLFGAPAGDTETNGKAPYEVKDMGWLHWTIVGCATLFMLLIFLALLSKKKKEEEPETAEVAAQE